MYGALHVSANVLGGHNRTCGDVGSLLLACDGLVMRGTMLREEGEKERWTQQPGAQIRTQLVDVSRSIT